MSTNGNQPSGEARRSASGRSLLSYAETASVVIAGVVIIVTMILMSADAFGRYFLNSPIAFQYELTQAYLMPICVLVPLSWAYNRGAFIKIDGLVHLVPRVVSLSVNIVALLLSALIFAVTSAYSTLDAYHAWISGDVILGVIDWPMYLAKIWVPIATALLTIRISADAWRLFSEKPAGEAS